MSRRNRSENHLLKFPRKINEPSRAAILQPNVELLTRSKCEVVQCIATKYCIAFVTFLQETHTTSNYNITFYVFFLIGAIHHAKHGIATLVRNYLTATLVQSSKMDSEMQWWIIMINDDVSITSICKLPKAPLLQLPLYNPQLYTLKISTVITYPGGIPPTTETEKIYMTGHIL